MAHSPKHKIQTPLMPMRCYLSGRPTELKIRDFECSPCDQLDLNFVSELHVCKKRDLALLMAAYSRPYHQILWQNKSFVPEI